MRHALSQTAHTRQPQPHELERLLAALDACRQTQRGQVVIIHSSGEHWAEHILEPFTRHLLTAREPHLEVRCQAAAPTYQPLRDLLLAHTRQIQALGLLHPPLWALIQQLDPFLHLSDALAPAWSLAPTSPRTPASSAATSLTAAPADTSAAPRVGLHDALHDLTAALSHAERAIFIVRALHLTDAATLHATLSLLDACCDDSLYPHNAPPFQGMWVITASDDLAAQLHATLGRRADAHFIALSGLDEQAVRSFLQRPDVVQRVLTSTEGRAEHLDALLQDLPSDADHILHRRLDRLPPAARDVLDLLAVCARPLSPEAITQLLGLPPHDFSAALRLLLDQRLLTQQVRRAEFLLDLPNHADPAVLQRAMPPARLRALHRAVGEQLEAQQRLGHPVEVESLAHHFLHSDDPTRASHYALAAASHLHASHAFPRAIEWLQAALPHTQDLTTRLDLLDRLIDLHRLTDNGLRALFYCGQRRRLTPPDQRAELQLKISQILIDIGRFPQALRAAQSTQLPPDAHPTLSLQRATLMAEALHNLGQWLPSSALCVESLDVPTTCPQTLRLHVHALNTQGKNLLSLERFDDARASFGRALSLCDNTLWDEERCRALLNCGVVALKQRRFPEAERAFERALHEGRRASHPHAQAFALLNLAVLYHRALDWSRALDCYLPALSLLRRNGSWLRFSNAALNLADLYLDLGDPARAHQLILSVEPHAPQGQPYYRVWIPWLLARVAIDQEQPSVALQHLDAAERALLTLATQHTPWAPSRGIFITRARLHLLHNDLPRFLSDIDRLPPIDTPRDDYWEAHASWLRGRACLLRAQPHDALPHLTAAASSFLHLNKPNWLWEVQCDLASLHASLDQLDAAQSLLDQARAHFASLCARVPSPLQPRFTSRPPCLRLFSALDALSRGDLPSLSLSSPPPSLSPRHPTSSTQTPRLNLLDTAETRAWRARFSDIIGEHPKLIETLRRIDRCAPSDSSVLILGESGSGKERLADAIHRLSPRAQHPLIKVNCGAFVESLLLSELFGHEKGAFTGALSSKPGRFELADGGTLFLDEVGDISPNTQVALLRVLQEGTFERVGGNRTLHANVRIVCATNRNLEQLVRSGDFRLDLYYRLKGIVIELPPLRDRVEDIPRLVHHFLNPLNASSPPRQLSRGALRALLCYAWPGNIRELQNFVRAISVLVPDPIIQHHHLSQLDAFFSSAPPVAPPPNLEHILDDVFGFTLPSSPPPPVAPPAPSLSTSSTPPARAPLSLTTPTAPAPAAAAAPATAPSPTPSATAPSAPALAASADPELEMINQVIDQKLGLSELKKRLEYECIRHALLRTQGNITQAASILQMKRPRLSQIVNACPDLRKLKDTSADADSLDDA
jgi:transcriptional regulator with GAF, ATPase, and Fis domain